MAPPVDGIGSAFWSPMLAHVDGRIGRDARLVKLARLDRLAADALVSERASQGQGNLEAMGMVERLTEPDEDGAREQERLADLVRRGKVKRPKDRERILDDEYRRRAERMLDGLNGHAFPRDELPER